MFDVAQHSQAKNNKRFLLATVSGNIFFHERRCPNFIALLLAASAMGLINPVNAQTTPDSGSILQETERDDLTLPPRDNDEGVPSPNDLGSETQLSGESVYIANYNITGNTKLSLADIQAVLAPFSGREITMGELQQAVDTLTAHYRSKGYLTATVLVPPHFIKDGVVNLRVVEGFLEPDGVLVDVVGTGLNQNYADKIVRNALKPGEVFNEETVDRALLLLRDTPGVSASAVILPGTQTGGGRYVARAERTQQFTGYVAYNNFGSAGTGKNKFSFGFDVNSPTGNGERLRARFVTTGDTSFYGFGELSLPIGYSGLRGAISVSNLHYELENEFRALRPEGDAFNIRASLSYPIIRSRSNNLGASIEFEHLSLEDEELGVKFSERKLDLVTAVLAGNNLDQFGGGGSTNYSFGATAGSVDLDGVPTAALIDTLTARTQGDFLRFNASVSRLQRLAGNWSALVSLSAQKATGNLDSSQQISLGGPQNLTGYPLGEVYGDSGVVAHFDIRYDIHNAPWGGHFQVATNFAIGKIILREDPFASSQPGNPLIENSFSLSSVGLGLNQNWNNKQIIRAMVGWQLKESPTRNPVTGENRDFSDSDVRFWIQSIFRF
ncbi:POTRA domain-containing protein [Parasphingorhabdus litoris]|uniref:POTRA domain-containing protein n=2 Tax=Parasphingorhabdus litoris TaxID=394733 RepID=A0ABN1AKZ2_9SPHN